MCIGAREKKIGIPVFSANSNQVARNKAASYKSTFSLPTEIFLYKSFDDFLERASCAIPEHARVCAILIDEQLCELDGLGSFDEISSKVIGANIPLHCFFIKS